MKTLSETISERSLESQMRIKELTEKIVLETDLKLIRKVLT